MPEQLYSQQHTTSEQLYKYDCDLLLCRQEAIEQGKTPSGKTMIPRELSAYYKQKIKPDESRSAVPDLQCACACMTEIHFAVGTGSASGNFGEGN